VSYEWSQPETGFEWSHQEFQTDWFLLVFTHVLWWLRDYCKEKVSLLDKWWAIVERIFFCLCVVVPYTIHCMLSFRARIMLKVFFSMFQFHIIKLKSLSKCIASLTLSTPRLLWSLYTIDFLFEYFSIKDNSMTIPLDNKHGYMAPE
jgi:hypothetical protein